MNNNAPFDENVFTWLLYCLAVGDKHLILRTREREILAVQKTVKSASLSLYK
jgi:hypothetical protein